jgi:gliding motility-associated-like protein
MKKTMKKQFIFLLFCLLPAVFYAQSAYHVDPSQFQYSMTFTTTLKIDGQESKDSLDMIYAFVNGECRGIGHTIDYLKNQKKYVVFLMVYGNNVEGDTVTFKIYSASKKIEYPLFNHVLFQSNGNYGTPEKPLINIVEEKLGAYNFISPNGDMVNDNWELLNNQLYLDFSVYIYNQTGEQIYYQKNNYQNNWDGKWKGTVLPDGAYYYLLMSPDKQYVYKGIINIIK